MTTDPDEIRRKHLDQSIRKTLSLIHEIEERLSLCSDILEKERLKKQLAGQKRYLKRYQTEHTRLGKPPDKTIDSSERSLTRVPPTTSKPMTTTTLQQPQPEAKSLALIIGINSYKKIRPLHKAVNDACDLRDVFMACGFLPCNCQLLLDNQADKGLINQALDSLARQARPQDRVVIFFAGHGARRIGGFEPGEYLCPVDAEWLELRNSAISDQELTTALNAIHADQLLLLLDACHSGGVGQPRDANTKIEAGLSEAAYSALASGKGRVVIASCQADELSREPGGMRNGVFTHCLLEGLRGAAAGPDGCVTVLKLFQYIEKQIAQHAKQRPLLKGELTNDWTLCQAAAPSKDIFGTGG